jgi:hypothetical protein
MTKKPTTAAVAPPTPNMRVEIRKITNGYVTTRSGITKAGQYVTKETFSATNPLKGPKS